MVSACQQRRPEPAARAGDHGDVGRRSSSRRCSVTRRPWCAVAARVRNCRARCGRPRHHRALRVDAGRVGQQRGVVDVHVGRAVHAAEAVGGRPARRRRPSARSSTGAPSSRSRGWRRRCPAARRGRAGRARRGAPRNEAYTSRAPASSSTSARRARPRPSRARSRRVSRYVRPADRARPGRRCTRPRPSLVIAA